MVRLHQLYLTWHDGKKEQQRGGVFIAVDRELDEMSPLSRIFFVFPYTYAREKIFHLPRAEKQGKEARCSELDSASQVNEQEVIQIKAAVFGRGKHKLRPEFGPTGTREFPLK